MRNLDIHNLLITILALLLSIIPHEVAHGYMSYKLGDTTAKEDGRLSLNPLNHIDPLGLLSMIVFRFGWAKAVPIDFSRIKGNKNLGIFLISIAGVTMNFIIAFVFSIFLSKALIAKDNFISEESVIKCISNDRCCAYIVIKHIRKEIILCLKEFSRFFLRRL